MIPIEDEKIPLDPVDPEILEQPPRSGLGEFAETIVDEDGQLDPDVLEDDEEKE